MVCICLNRLGPETFLDQAIHEQVKCLNWITCVVDQCERSYAAS